MVFLPMLDMTPSDPNSINSTLHFICNHAKKYNCTYTNVYAKYNRYKNRLAQGLVHTDNIRSLPMDIYTIHKQIVEENMSYQELAEEYKTSYQNVYNYYKRHKSKLIS